MGINYDKQSFITGIAISQLLRGYFGNGMSPPGNTKALLNLSTSSLLTQNIYFTQSQANGVVIDWGDGSPRETVADLSANARHVYPATGQYVIQFIPENGVTWSPGATITSSGTTTSYSFISGFSSMKSSGNTTLVMFVFGKGATLQQTGAFSACKSLRSVNIPEVTHIPDKSFQGCENLKLITIPSSVISVGDYAFENCKSADFAPIIPQLTNTIGAHAFEYCERISEDIEIRAISVGNCAFGSCTRLRHAWLRNSVQTLNVDITTTSGNTNYYGPFYQCKNTLVLYAECTEANKPVGWATGFNYDETTSQSPLTVIWAQDHKPVVSLSAEWNCHGRVLTFIDATGEGEVYTYNSSSLELTIY